MLTLQIGIGIWLGGLFLWATGAAYFSVAARIEKNRQWGRPWYRSIVR